MSLVKRTLKIGGYLLFGVGLVRLAIVGRTENGVDGLSMWLVVSAVTAFWLSAWAEGVYPGLAFQRKGHEREFLVLQVVTGIAIGGLCFLVATAF